MKRVFIIVLDSLGIGAEPDAADFGDVGANTLRSVSAGKGFAIPHLLEAGMGNLDGVDYLPRTDKPTAALARLRERSRGKDTTIGHWELAGVVSPTPLPTYPDGFPAEVLDAFTQATGRGVLCNKPYSGTEVIKDYGEEHLKTGKLIVYTSADSVFQIAAHESLVPPEQLYAYCRAARKILQGKHGGISFLQHCADHFLPGREECLLPAHIRRGSRAFCVLPGVTPCLFPDLLRLSAGAPLGSRYRRLSVRLRFREDLLRRLLCLPEDPGFHFIQSTHALPLLLLYLDPVHCQEGDKEREDRVCLYHGREQHRLTELLRLLRHDADRGSGCLPL